MTFNALLSVAATSVYLLATAACDVKYVPVDPDVTVVGDGDGPSGPATAELGFYFTDEYTRFEQGDGLPVVNGLQGGTWTMPVIRTENLGTFSTVACEITVVETEEVVGFMTAKTKFFLSPDGFYEALNVPIPVYHANAEGRPIDDLFGQLALVACSVTDKQERSASFEISLELVEGVDP